NRITVVWFFCSECSLELLGLTKSLCSLRIFKVLHTVQFSRFFASPSKACPVMLTQKEGFEPSRRY
ncbi:hypothetical protein PMZ84_05410, partial [[Clostridium] symbiosum]|uniref:hypothetical protein n=1 Tax=Clostridium symbiosum TaxID=1512 RepID=UPI001A9C1C37